jgi:hypothetical protein
VAHHAILWCHHTDERREQVDAVTHIISGNHVHVQLSAIFHARLPPRLPLHCHHRRVDTISLACYAVRRRRVQHLAEHLVQAFQKAKVTHTWAEAELTAIEAQLAALTETTVWGREDTLKVIPCSSTSVA